MNAKTKPSTGQGVARDHLWNPAEPGSNPITCLDQLCDLERCLILSAPEFGFDFGL